MTVPIPKEAKWEMDVRAHGRWVGVMEKYEKINADNTSEMINFCVFAILRDGGGGTLRRKKKTFHFHRRILIRKSTFEEIAFRNDRSTRCRIVRREMKNHLEKKRKCVLTPYKGIRPSIVWISLTFSLSERLSHAHTHTLNRDAHKFVILCPFAVWIRASPRTTHPLDGMPSSSSFFRNYSKVEIFELFRFLHTFWAVRKSDSLKSKKKK